MSEPSFKPIKKFVRAGAGAGKTWNLTREVITQALDYHAEMGQWPKTVLTTFTRKATQELKQRLLVYCLEEKPEALEFVQSTSFLHITTMHGLLNIFLSRYGYSMGLPSQFKIVDRSQADFWRKQILREMIADSQQWPLLQVFDFRRLLNNLKAYESIYWEQQASPIRSTQQFESLIQDLLQPTAQDLQQVVSEGPQCDPGESWDDFFASLNRLLEILSQKTPWGEKRQKLQVTLSALKKPRKSKNNPGLSEDLNDVLATALKDLKKWAVDPEYAAEHWPKVIASFLEFEKFATQFMDRLTEKKRTEAALEPDDLEFYSLHIGREKPEITRRFSEDVNAWFIDEFQDTSPLQLKILEPMIGESSCYIVGDPQQSIYLFRGSRSEVFLEKHQAMQKQGAEVLSLQKNYRSQENLLSFFNQFFPVLDASFSEMEATQDPIQSSAAVVVSVNTTEEDDNEIFQISQQLGELMDQGVSPKDICILTRTHGQIDELHRELSKLGFPVLSHASSDYFKRREILDAIAFLKILINPWDDKSLVLIMRSPWMALSDSTIKGIIGEQRENFWPLFKDYFVNNKQQQPGQALLQAFAKKNVFGVGWVFRKLLLQLGMFDYSHQIDSTGRREANLWKLVNLIEKNSREPGGSLLRLANDGALASSLDDFGDGADASSAVEPNKIHLMTIHASKGLQFEYVFLPFLHKKPQETTFQDFTKDSERALWSFRLPLVDQSQFSGGVLEPLCLRDMKRRESEEANRVFYVAMTRAKHKLFMSWNSKVDRRSWAAATEQILDGRTWSHLQRDELLEVAPRTIKWGEASGDIVPPFAVTLPRFANEAGESEPASTEERNWLGIQGAQQNRREGVVLHRIFETLKNHDPETTKRLASRWLPHRNEETAAAIDFILNHDEVPFAAIIDQGFVEWGYRVDLQGQTKERRIDLWGVVDEQLWIVDYKTGSTAFKDKAFLQMQEYAQSLKQLLGWQKAIKMVAVFPFSRQYYEESY